MDMAMPPAEVLAPLAEPGTQKPSIIVIFLRNTSKAHANGVIID
jgi:hypothetical protein